MSAAYFVVVRPETAEKRKEEEHKYNSLKWRLGLPLVYLVRSAECYTKNKHGGCCRFVPAAADLSLYLSLSPVFLWVS